MPSCAPVVERGRVYIEAARDIRPGDEPTYDCAYRREGGEPEERYACRCGARRCRGTLLSPRRSREG